MAFTKLNPPEHIRGLAEPARQLKAELEAEETRNFEECMAPPLIEGEA